MAENNNKNSNNDNERPRGNVKMPGARLQKDSLNRLIGFIFKTYKGKLFLVVLCIIVAALVSLSTTLFQRQLIDTYILPLIGSSAPDFAPLAETLIKLGCVMLIGIISAYTYQRIMMFVTQGTMKVIRTNLFEHMESLPISFFDTHQHGDVMSVYTNDTDTLRQMIGQSFPQLINSVMNFTGTLVSMIVLNIPLTLLSLFMVFVMLRISTSLAKKSGTFFVEQQKNLGTVNGYIEEMMEGQKVVKVFTHEQKSIDRFREVNDELRKSAFNANRIANIIMPINGNMGNISYVLCAIVGAVIALNTKTGLTLGTLATFLALNKGFSMPITQISQQINAIVMASAGAKRIYDIMDENSETDEGYVELVNATISEDGTITESEEKTGTWAWKHPHHSDGSVTYKKLEGGILFDGVDFGYTPDKIVLHDIKMYANPGQKIALVGSTGAGKTTITNLITRFYDIQDGKIRYDEININKIKKADLRRSLGMVLQDTHLFTGTVMDNIRFGRLDATDEECIAAAKLANAHNFIKRLPDGYQTKLTGDGGSLSQGQRQLLSIARAAVADPPALILDEATSSIDTRTESLVQKGMDALMKGRTTFVIAHRLSTVKNADCIMVLENGRIIERGTHDELIAQKGRYYQLYTGNSITEEE